MNVLVFDTETTGKVEFRAPASDPKQPRLVQFAALLFDDETGEEIASVSTLVKPDGWTIPEDVAKLHGITTEKAEKFGIPIQAAMRIWAGLFRVADLHVAHNIIFDWTMFQVEMLKLGQNPKDFQREQFCTMQQSTNIVKIKGPRGFKWPKLSETYQHFFGKDFEGAHNAMNDVQACAAVYREMKRTGKGFQA